MSEILTIRKIIDRIISGDIRIPAFQRGYVWLPTQVAFLLDSLYKGYPVGTLFLWNTSSRLKNEKMLGNFELPPPKKDYPVNYVLDGQQRITSIFSVFQTELQPSGNLEWTNVYYDIASENTPQESCFFALEPEEVDISRHFPMNTLFDSVKYREATSMFSQEQVVSIDRLQERFKEVFLPVQEYSSDERERVAIVFERINRAGTELDTYQLLTAWSWSEDFDLQEKLENLSAEVAPFGFKSIGADKDLVLKCFSGYISGDTSPGAILNLTGDQIRNSYVSVKEGLKGAIDFLRKELNVLSYEIMPYPAMIVSLTKFFATDYKSGFKITDKQRKSLIAWFWRCNLSRRYSAGVGKAHSSDIKELTLLKHDENHLITLGVPDIDVEWFMFNLFNINTINSRTFVLMLASCNPVSFISGAKVNLEMVLKSANKNEFHHIFPKSYLGGLGEENNAINCLSNICFLSSSDNQSIKDKSPSVYKGMVPVDSREIVAKSAMCPVNFFDLGYDDFLVERSGLLVEYAKKLCT